MSLQRYLLAFRQRWLVVVAGAALGLVGGLGAFLMTPSEYTAATSLYVSAQLTDTTAEAFQGAQLAQQQAQSYTELGAGPRVTEQVVQELGLPISADALSNQITVTNRANSSIITVSVTDHSSAVATSVANTTANVLVALVADLERPTGGTGVAPVTLTVVQPAAPPLVPSSLSLSDVLTIGLFVGLAVGSAAALAANARRTPVRSPEQLSELTAVPNLGVYRDDSKRSRPWRPGSPPAEASRRLRTNLKFVGGAVPPRVIAVTSSVPHEGTTTTVFGLATALTAAGCSVVLVEANLRSPSLARLLHLRDDIPGLSETLAGSSEPQNATQRWNDTLDVVAAGSPPPDASELVSSDRLEAVVDSLRRTYDYVLLDCPPLLPVADTASIVPITDGAVVVCRYATTDGAQVVSAMESLDAVSGRVLGTVLTMAPGGRTVYPFERGRGQEPQDAAGPARNDAFPRPGEQAARAPHADPSVPDRCSVAAIGVER
ncbi:MAG: polysaccharide biosynthesis tyrosine autokinase [Pseudonocardia sp.]|nr:polysaccharide biosynthesis tyrosine autokinase [Pseudonocardia sp.]